MKTLTIWLIKYFKYEIKSFQPKIERHIVPISFPIDYGSQAAIKAEN